MDILLGIYRTPTFSELVKNSKLQTYPFIGGLEDWDNYIHLDIIDLVAVACNKCDTIHFSLDNIRLPLSNESYTCSELGIILSDPILLNKTLFYLDKHQLSEEEFNTWLNK